MDMSDKEYLKQYIRGDVEAIEALVIKYRRPLFGYIINMTEGRDEADEIFQEVWLRVIKKIATYRHKNFFGWIVRIAHNVVIDRARRRKPVVSMDIENDNGGTMKDVLSNDDPGPEAELVASDLGNSISKAVTELPLEQREVFVMRSQSKLSFKEIAKIQKISINTALARMQYAMSKLRSLLKDQYAELEAI